MSQKNLLRVIGVIILIAASYWAWITCIKCWLCPNTCYTSPGKKNIPVEKVVRLANGIDTLIKGDVPVQYHPRQIILTPGNRADEWHKYLKSKGLKLNRKCSCNDSLELWEVPKNKPDVDLIGVITDPPINKGSGVGGLNYMISYEPLDTSRFRRLNPGGRRSEPKVAQQPVQHKNIIKIGNIDSGIDSNRCSPLRKERYLSSAAGNTCGWGNGVRFGQNMLDPNKEPIDDTGHGNFIAGILAGIAGTPNPLNNSQNTKFDILNIKTTEGNTGYLFDALCGLYSGLSQGVKVFNISWGYLDTLETSNLKILDVFFKTSSAKGVVVVAAMGNNSVSLDSGKARFWPACMAEYYPNVISVGACDTSGRRAVFSNYSSNPKRMTLMARGVDIISIIPNNTKINTICPQYAKGSGTSFATPLATRAVALFWASNNNISAKEVRQNFLNLNQHFVNRYPPPNHPNQPVDYWVLSH